ncbi:thermonuclease family protein [Priestia sp. SB1]|uniref:thermonuclease family protein n=1 Tax=Priestia sp. SB1 TaxID=3132359 RepID=UPI0031772C47
MKKWLISFLMITLVLTGCAESPSSSSTNDTNNATKTEDVSKGQTPKEEASKTTESTDDDSNEKTQEKPTKEESQTTQSKETTNNKETTKTTSSTTANNVSKYPTFETTVTAVIDGDTFHTLINNKDEKIRLIMADSPEVVSPKIKGKQPWGESASVYTKSVLKPGTKVNLELDTQERDRYGRILAYVYVNGKMLNETLIEKGLARVAVFPPNTRYVDEFREIQEKAKQQKLGIWSIDGYVGEKGFNSNSQSSTNSSQSSSSQNSTSSSTNSNSSGSSNTSSTNSSTQPFQNNPADDVETNTSCKNKIKGNANSKIYHIPGGAYYDKTVDNIVWFCTEQDARNQGYRKSQR